MEDGKWRENKGEKRRDFELFGYFEINLWMPPLLGVLAAHGRSLAVYFEEYLA